MKVVFLEEVEGSGLVGEIKEVKNGYARNYLLPRRLAAPATKATVERAAKLARLDAVRQDQADEAAQLIAKRIDGTSVELEAKVGEQGRLFGSVTAADIAAQLSERAGEKIEHRQVLLGQAIKAIGTQDVRVRLTRNVFASVTVEVVSEDGEEPEPAPPAELAEEPEASAETPEEAEADEAKADDAEASGADEAPTNDDEAAATPAPAESPPETN